MRDNKYFFDRRFIQSTNLHNERLLSPVFYLFLFCIFSIGFASENFAIAICVISLFITLLYKYHKNFYGKIDTFCLVLIVICPLSVLLSIYIHRPPEHTLTSTSSKLWFWALMFAGAAMVYIRFAILKLSPARLRLAVPTGLIVLFVSLSVDKFTAIAQSQLPCRITGFTGLPFTPALVYSSFTLFYLSLWSHLSRTEKYLGLTFIILAGIVVVSYTQSRGITLGFLFGISLIVAVLIAMKPRDWMVGVVGIPVAITASLGASSLVDDLTDCRSVAVFHPLYEIAADMLPHNGDTNHALDPAIGEPQSNGEHDAPSPPSQAEETVAPDAEAPSEPSDDTDFDPSIDGRLIMWKLGLDLYAQDPLIGSGRWSEEVAVASLDELPGQHDHVHQQYISWLIWFGVPGLISGIAFLAAAAPWIVYGTRGSERLLLMIAACSVLPVALLFDSLLRLSSFLLFSMLYQAMIIAYCRWCWLQDTKDESV
jgi:hypothetical protein